MTRSRQLAILMMVILWTAPVLEGASGDSEPRQLLGNPGFEAFDPRQPSHPDQWSPFCRESGKEQIELVADVSHGGDHSVRLVGRGTRDSFEGIFQAHDVVPGHSYRFAIEVRNDPSKPIKGSIRGQIAIEWKDATGKEIGRAWGGDWGGDAPTDAWKHYDMKARSPDGAAAAHFVVVLHEGPDPGGGAFYVDDALATENP